LSRVGEVAKQNGLDLEKQLVLAYCTRDTNSIDSSCLQRIVEGDDGLIRKKKKDIFRSYDTIRFLQCTRALFPLLSSFKLGYVYSALSSSQGWPPEQAHLAEADCRMLARLIKFVVEIWRPYQEARGKGDEDEDED